MERKFFALIIAFFAIFALNACSSGGGSTSRPHYVNPNPSPTHTNPDIPTIYGISVGINNYASYGYHNSLRYSVKDSTAMVQALSFGSQNNLWSRATVISLNDTQAKKSNIMSKLNEIANKIGPNDVFFMFYSGHGNAERATGASSPDNSVVISGETYIIPIDNDGTIYTAISSSELKEVLSKMPDNTKKILIFDSCFSGGFISKSANDDPNELVPKCAFLSHPEREYYPEDLGFKSIGNAIKNVFFTTSSSYNELSYEDPQKEQGAYTYHLLQGLGINGYALGAASSPGTMIGIRELFNYAYAPTVQSTSWVGEVNPRYGSQHPQLYTSTANANCNIKGNL